jgi:hypothetical protein
LNLFGFLNLVLRARSEREDSAVTYFFIRSTGVMEHWSIGRRGIQSCPTGGQGKIVTLKITIHAAVFLWLFQYSITPALHYSRKKGSIQTTPFQGNPKPEPHSPASKR